MQSFGDDRHEFTVRGQKYHLDPIDLNTAVGLAQLEGKEFAAQVDALTELMISHAGTDTPTWWLRVRGKKNPADAVRSLSVRQQAELFGQWIRWSTAQFGVVPGESGSSAS